MDVGSEGTALLWFLLEAAIAGALLVAIIWWTLSPARKRDREAENDEE